jgi:hypothetical protein
MAQRTTVENLLHSAAVFSTAGAQEKNNFEFRVSRICFVRELRHRNLYEANIDATRLVFNDGWDYGWRTWN